MFPPQHAKIHFDLLSKFEALSLSAPELGKQELIITALKSKITDSVIIKTGHYITGLWIHAIIATAFPEVVFTITTFHFQLSK